MDKYPYFLYPAICELQNHPVAERAKELKEFLAANIGDRHALLALTGVGDEELHDFYPSQDNRPQRDDSSIDSFISKFSSETPPYIPTILQEIDNHDEALERAKKMVKNHDYTGALEIMEAIYLNNPKKSIYFADQIRFIRKLKLNDSKKH